MERSEPTLRDLAVAFNRISLVSLGGGAAAWAHRILVEDRHWMSDEEFLHARAMSQILPGPNMFNLAVMIGARFHGGVGAATALLGLVICPLIVALILGIGYLHGGQVPAVQHVFNGLAASAAGASFGTAIKLALPRIREAMFVGLSIAVFAMVGLLHWPMIPVTLGVTLFSLLLYRSLTRKEEGPL